MLARGQGFEGVHLLPPVWLGDSPLQRLVVHLRCLGHGQESAGVAFCLPGPPTGTQPPVAWSRPGLPWDSICSWYDLGQGQSCQAWFLGH